MFGGGQVKPNRWFGGWVGWQLCFLSFLFFGLMVNSGVVKASHVSLPGGVNPGCWASKHVSLRLNIDQLASVFLVASLGK